MCAGPVSSCEIDTHDSQRTATRCNTLQHTSTHSHCKTRCITTHTTTSTCFESPFKWIHNTALYETLVQFAIEKEAHVFPFFPSFELVKACNINERLEAPFENSTKNNILFWFKQIRVITEALVLKIDDALSWGSVLAKKNRNPKSVIQCYNCDINGTKVRRVWQIMEFIDDERYHF